jgi:protein PhnA
VFQKIKTMSDTVICPKCQSEFTYEQDNLQVCSQCFHEWDPNEVNSGDTILDMNGNELQNGDSVIVMKDLPVKGAPKPVKAGTKVKNIRLRPDSDHNIDCKIDGFGAMALKSEFVKKA